MKFNLKANHLINGGLIILGAAFIIYNKVRAGEALSLEDLLPLTPMLGQYANALKAHSSDSTKWISPKQAICIMEMARERGMDARAYALQQFNVELGSLLSKQATTLILKMKKIPKLQTGNEADHV
ncbi:MAG: hypothetical protein WBV94_20610 [Blastocatellia bacterium]